MRRNLESRLKRIEKVDANQRRRSEPPGAGYVVIDEGDDEALERVLRSPEGRNLKVYYRGCSPDDL